MVILLTVAILLRSVLVGVEVEMLVTVLVMVYVLVVMMMDVVVYATSWHFLALPMGFLRLIRNVGDVWALDFASQVCVVRPNQIQIFLTDAFSQVSFSCQPFSFQVTNYPDWLCDESLQLFHEFDVGYSLVTFYLIVFQVLNHSLFSHE